MTMAGKAIFTVKNPRAPSRAAAPAAGAGSARVAQYAAWYSPYRTGRLRAGWKVVPGRYPSVFLVVNDVPYARFVEFGANGVPPAAMLAKATRLAVSEKWARRRRRRRR